MISLRLGPSGLGLGPMISSRIVQAYAYPKLQVYACSGVSHEAEDTDPPPYILHDCHDSNIEVM